MTAFVAALVLSQTMSFLMGRVDFGADNYVWSAYWGNFSWIAQLPVFVLGIILYHLCVTFCLAEKIRDFYVKRYSARALSEFSYAATIAIVLIAVFFLKDSGSLILFGILFAGLFFINMIFPTKIICNTLFSHLGRYSYGIYLFHYIMIVVVNRYFGGGNQVIPFREGYFVLILVFAYVASVVGQLVIEKSLQKYVKIVKNNVLN